MEEFPTGDDEWRLFELLGDGSEFDAHIFALPALQPDGGREDCGVLLAIDDVFDWGQEDWVVEIDET